MTVGKVKLGLTLPAPIAERLRELADASGLSTAQAATVLLAGQLLGGGEEPHD